MSHSFMFHAELPGYLEWLDARGPAEWGRVYELYRDQLRLLQWWQPGRRWVLKSPVHLWNLEPLLQVFPDAIVIQLQREPGTVMESFCRLLAAHRDATWKGGAPDSIGRQALAYMRNAINRAVAARQKFDPSHFIDIGFEELTQEPLRTVQAIYSRLGADLTPHAAASMNSWLAQQEQVPPRKRLHDSSFGIDPDEAREAFAPFSALLRRESPARI